MPEEALKVPIAMLADGRSIHVSALTGRGGGPYTCPGCGQRLGVRGGDDRLRRRHFYHVVSRACSSAVESGLHLFAKDALNRALSMALPAVVSAEAGLQEQLYPVQVRTFQRAAIEERFAGFRPDVVLYGKGPPLLVEVEVTHAVDEQKAARIAGAGLSALEIDLSSVRHLEISSDELAELILYKAPRAWIYNKKAEQHRPVLAARAKEKRRLKAEALRSLVFEAPMGDVPHWIGDKAMPAIKELGLTHLTNLPTRFAHWFEVAPDVWQPAILYLHVIAPARTYDPHYRHCLRLKPALNGLNLGDELLRRDLPAHLDPQIAGDIGLTKARYGTPALAVEDYWRAIAARSRLVAWSDEDACFRVSADAHGLIYRTQHLKNLVTSILESADVDDPTAVYQAWAAEWATAEGGSPSRVVLRGGEAYDALVSKLGEISRMTYGHARSVADDLCGLPLDAYRDAKAEAIEADRLKREQRAAEERLAEAERRRRSIVRAAARELWSGADDYLARPAPAGSGTLIEWGCTDDSAEDAVLMMISREGQRRAAEALAQERRGAALSALRSAARASFRSDAHVDVFMNSHLPRLRGRRPIDVCVDDTSLELCKSLLPQKR